MPKSEDIRSWIKGVPELTKQINDLNKSVSQLVQTTIKGQQAFNSQSKSQQDVANKSKVVGDTAKRANEIEKERLKLLERLKKANTDRIQANEELKVQLQEQNKINKQLAKEKLGLIGAYEKESRRLVQLRKKYKDLAVQNKQNTKEGKALRKEITTLDSKLKGIDKTVGQHQRNVGNYGDALNALPGRFGLVINSIKMFSKALLATPIGWIIGLIAGAGAALKNFFTGSVEGQERWNKVMNRAKGVASVFKDELIKAGKGIADFTRNIKDSEGGVKGWAKSVGEKASGAWRRFRDDIQDEGLWNTLKDRGEGAVNAIKGKVDDLNDSLEENRNRADEITAIQNKLRKDEISALTTTAQLRKEVAELRAEAADREKVDALTRIQLLDEAIEKQNEILNVEENLARQRIRAQKLLMEQGENTLEDYEELARLETELINLETANAEKRRRFTAERLTSQREWKSEVQSTITEVEKSAAESVGIFSNSIAEIEAEIEGLIDNETKSIDKSIDERISKELEAIEIIKSAREEAALEIEEAIKTIATDQFNARIDDRLARFQESQDAEEEILKNRLDKGLINEQEYEEELKKLRLETRQEEAKAEKKKALFDIAINTASAIVKALSNPALIPFIIATGAAQATAVAARPIPQFRHGGLMKEDGAAKFSEEGSELAILPSGHQVLTPEQETIGYLPKGTKIFPAYSRETKEAKQEGTPGYNELIKETKLLRKDLRNQSHHNVVITDGGYQYLISKNKNTQKWIDKYLRHI
jgi:hypothetical protein